MRDAPGSSPLTFPLVSGVVYASLGRYLRRENALA